mmetsp:Transcript_52102/g.93371  ORF Transcript_52102/g.93371 Transcript_52102/m.93371 type:complete len:641 (+) Transcript_52102:122-2044(+)
MMRRRAAFSSCALMLALIADASPGARKELKMPLSALTGDDPCLDDLSSDRAECGTALLQSGSHRSPSKEASGSARKVLRKPGVSASSPAKAATYVLEDMRQLVTEVKLEQRKPSEVQDHLTQYVNLLEVEAGSKVQEDLVEHSRLLKEHVASFSSCDADLQGRLESGNKLRSMHSSWSRLHEDCRRNELQLAERLAKCQGESSASHVCAGAERFLSEKKSECDTLQKSMHAANCARTSQVSGVCEMYELCRQGMSIAYTSAKHSVQAWERHHKAEGLAAATLHCFAEVSRTAEHANWLADLQLCEEKANTTLQPMEFEEIPAAIACSPVTEDDTPCQEELSASSAATAGLDADLSREVVAGVSLMQEGIERATVALPKGMHEAFFGALATPVALVVVVVTFLMLMVRCFGVLREKHAESKQLQADALCISSQTSTPDASDAWLCQELIVPRKSRCSISVPRLGLEEGALRSALVTDKMGQPLFKASLAAIQAPSKAGAEQLTLSRQDGTVLVSCSLVLPTGKSRGRCDIMRRDGSLFASLDWHEQRVTWLSWLSVRKRNEPSAFVLKGAEAKAWHFRVVDEVAGGRERHLLDELRRPVARASLSESETAHILQIEVSSERTADLGLVLATLLAVDRLASA